MELKAGSDGRWGSRRLGAVAVLVVGVGLLGSMVSLVLEARPAGRDGIATEGNVTELHIEGSDEPLTVEAADPIAVDVPGQEKTDDEQISVEENDVAASDSQLSAAANERGLRAVPSAERIGNALYFSDFAGELGPEWALYDSPGHAGWGLRRPSAISIGTDVNAESGGVLNITARQGTEGDEAGKLVSGGLKLQLPQTYGRYAFRIRVDGDPTKSTSGVGLLWPTSLEWPRDGEIDIFETWGRRDTRTPVETNVHHLAHDASEPYTASDDRLIQFTWPELDGTEWNVFQLYWEADRLSLAVNGGPPQLLIDEPKNIPQTPMEIAFQLDGFDQPDRPGMQPQVDGEVTLQVDWVLVETL